MLPYANARRELADVCRRLHARGLISALEGNASARLPDGNLLVTPAGVPKAELTADQLVVVDPAGGVCDGGRPTSELALHLRVYDARVDVNAVVHAHPPAATGFAVAGTAIPYGVLPEAIVFLGPVALVPYAMPGTAALADAVAPYAAGHDTLLLAHHGAVTLGATISLAHCRMESLEHAARILLAARLIGSATPLTPDQVAALEAHRTRDDPAGRARDDGGRREE